MSRIPIPSSIQAAPAASQPFLHAVKAQLGSVPNLFRPVANPKVHLFLMDHARRRRVKIWGTARVIEGDAELVARLMPAGYRASADQAIVLTVTAWDVNCPQHIPVLLPAAEVQRVLAGKDLKIATLEAEVARLRATAVQART